MKKPRLCGRRSEEILKILERYRKSGLSQPAFSKRHGVAVSTLQYWLRKERDGQFAAVRPTRTREANRLVPVRIVDGPAAGPEALLELELPRGGKLRFPCEVPPQTVARYAEALGYRC